MSVSVAARRWWGWGERDMHVPAGLLRLLHEEAGVDVDAAHVHVRDIADVRIPRSALAPRVQRRLVAAAGAGSVTREHDARVLHATGRSYLDLLALRSGVLDAAPDAVVTPRDAEAVTRVLRLCADTGCAIVPFGGGTSVVGGVRPDRRAHDAVVALSLRALRDPVDVDTTSRLATLQAGMTGPEADEALARHGLTLGHVPQSYEQATLGGYAATRSAGQASSGYGRFDEMVRGIHVVAPNGAIDVPASTPSATGPSLLDMLLGSEGTLGVITHVTVRVREMPRFRHVAGWSFADFDAGCDALREVAQRDVLPDITRLSDADESRASFAMSDGRATAFASRYLRARGHIRPCLAILGWDGDAFAVGERARHAARVLRRHGAVALGTAPGRAWLRSRFDGPYLRDALLDHGVLVETIETSATWRDLIAVRRAVVTALHESLGDAQHAPLVGCHVSHVYPEGASLYVTVLARQQAGREREQWLRAKERVTTALLAAGGALSHHHGIGADHAPWLTQVHGATGAGMLQALRTQLDPSGVMNPGVLAQ